jgi:hypothetical protein
MLKFIAGFVVGTTMTMIGIVFLTNHIVSQPATKLPATFKSPGLLFAIQTDNGFHSLIDSAYSQGYAGFLTNDSSSAIQYSSWFNGWNSLIQDRLSAEYWRGWTDAKNGKPNRLKPLYIAVSKNPGRLTGVLLFPFLHP